MPIAEQFERELLIRGFTLNPAGGWVSPLGTVLLSESYASTEDLIELLDAMIWRRDQCFRATEVAASRSYDEVVLVVDAIKSVFISRETPAQGSDAVDAAIAALLRSELLLRGFTENARGSWVSPNNGVWLSATHVPTLQRLIELLDDMVLRRERIRRSAGDVGADIARQNFDDTVLVVDAIKVMLRRLGQP